MIRYKEKLNGLHYNLLKKFGLICRNYNTNITIAQQNEQNNNNNNT